MKRLLILTVLVCLAAASGGTHVLSFKLAQQTDVKVDAAERSAQVDALMNPLIQGDGPGAAVMVIQDGRVVHGKGYGLARLDTKEAVGLNTAFDISSTSKQFTAMAVMILVERGKLNYDDPLTKFFPEFPSYARTITVRHLLNHTSGLVDALNPQWYRKGYYPTAKDLVKMMVKEKNVRFAPGEKFEYNNAGYVLLALIVEKASGQSFARFMKENVFQPLGMNSTVILDESKPKIERMAVSYFFEGNEFKPYQPTSDIFFYGAKGVISTLEDMYRWEQALAAEKLVKASTLKQAFTPGRLNSGTETIYGFGWYIVKDNGLDVYEHAGGYLAYRSNIRRYPAQRLTVILLSNNALIEPTSLTKKISQIYLSDRAKGAVAMKVDAAILKEYVGKYEADPKVMANLIIEITLEDGELYITSLIKPKTKLIALSPTEFQITDTASSVIFNRDEKRAVGSLTLKTRRAVFDAKKVIQ
jgi:D-alanyl-D-alanine carboxypeptidase